MTKFSVFCNMCNRLTVFLLGLCATVTVCAQGMSNRNKAKALNRQAVLLVSELRSTADSVLYYQKVQKAVKMALLSDHYDSKPDGKKANGKYRKSNRHIVVSLYDTLADGAMFFYSGSNNASAKDCFTLCMDVSASSLFAGVDDRERGKIAYYASLLALGEREFANAARYADVAKKDPCYAKEATEIKIACMKENLVTRADSVSFFKELRNFYSLDPNNRTCFKLLMEHFACPGHEHEMEIFADSEIKKDSTDKLAWVLKGEALMRGGKWTAAIAAYTAAVRIDSLFVEAVYNLGICYCAQAQQSKKVEDLEAGAGYLEKASRLDPGGNVVGWRIPLEQANAILNEYRIKERKTEND